MTIGIAAWGPEAAAAALRALGAVEAAGRGAIGGFVSLVALTDAGGVARREVQRGGAAALLAERPLSPEIAGARCVGLMSSGPDRPAPLSAFTPARGGCGLVTGHRLPNAPGPDGTPLNARVLEAMAMGAAPQEAVRAVIAECPEADAGYIAMTVAGAVHGEDAPRVMRRRDCGAALMRAPDGAAVVAVRHNGVEPHRPLAALAAEIALDQMTRAAAGVFTAPLAAGAPLALGPAAAVELDEAGRVARLRVADPALLTGRHDIGLGDRVDVLQGGRRVGWLDYEPYIVAADGRLTSVDGATLAEMAIWPAPA